MNKRTFYCGSYEVEIERPRLKQWLFLEDIRKEIKESITKKNIKDYEKGLYKFIHEFFTDIEIEKVSWQDTLTCYMELVGYLDSTIKFPLLEYRTEDKSLEWDYPERTWYYWSNLFAMVYGWTLEYIANLSIEDGIGLIQEIIVDKFSAKEWEYSLSDVAYPYNPTTKKSSYKPLEKPGWMMNKKDTPKMTKIRKDLVPIGNVVDLSDIIKER